VEGFKATCPDFIGLPVLPFSSYCLWDGELRRTLSSIDRAKGNNLNSWVEFVPSAWAASVGLGLSSSESQLGTRAYTVLPTDKRGK
jgi:hypothetical protein